jgi:hypothetical protein
MLLLVVLLFAVSAVDVSTADTVAGTPLLIMVVLNNGASDTGKAASLVAVNEAPFAFVEKAVFAAVDEAPIAAFDEAAADEAPIVDDEEADVDEADNAAADEAPIAEVD